MRIPVVVLAVLLLGCHIEKVRVLEWGKDASCAPPDAGVPPDAGPIATGLWPMYAHDTARSARADGVGALRNPEPVWSTSVGGTLQSNQIVETDLEGDGTPAFLHIHGGRLAIVRADGERVLSGAEALLGAWDVDGEGQKEILVRTKRGASLLRADGSLRTEFVGSVGFATFVPSGTGTLVVSFVSDGTTRGYTFEAGKDPTLRFALENTTSQPGLPVDLRGNGQFELLRPLTDGFAAHDAQTGAQRTEVHFADRAFFYLYEIGDIDGVPGDEIVVLDTSYVYSPSAGIHVLSDKGTGLFELWSDTTAATLPLSVDYETRSGSAADLVSTSPGKEFVYSVFEKNTWVTHVVSAKSGTKLQSLEGELLEGVFDVDGDGTSDLITRRGARADKTAGELHGYRGGIAERLPWTVANARMAVSFNAPWFSPRSWGLQRPLFLSNAWIVEVGGRGTSQVGVMRPDGQLGPFREGAAALLARATPSDALLLVDADGVAHELGPRFEVGRSFATGTFAARNLVVPASSGAAILAPTSRDELRRLDPAVLGESDGGLSPPVTWSEPHVHREGAYVSAGYATEFAVVLRGERPKVVSLLDEPDGQVFSARHLSGDLAWRLPLPGGYTVHISGLYPLRDDAETEGFAVFLADTHSTVYLGVVDGRVGSLARLSPLPALVSGADHGTTGALVDLNEDGRLELVIPIHSVGVVGFDLGSTMSTHFLGVTPNATNGNIAAIPLAPSVDLLRTNGNSGFGALFHLSRDGKVLRSRDPELALAPDLDQNWVTFVRRAGTGFFDPVHAGSAGNSMLTRMHGETLETVWRVYASRGVISKAEPQEKFSLHDPIAFDADGDGAEDVVFGSDDGFVYGVVAETGALAFARDLGTPVRHLLAANLDLDPELELLASTADGKIVALDERGRYHAARPEGPAVCVAPSAPEPVSACSAGPTGRAPPFALLSFLFGLCVCLFRGGQRERM